MNQLKSLFALVMVSALTACSGTPVMQSGEVTDSEVTSDTAPGVKDDAISVEVLAANAGLVEKSDSMGQSLDDMKMVDITELHEPVIYFGYDQYELDDASTEVVKFYAQEMQANPKQKVVLKGHTDERGTPEYNLALGEKRAKTVAQAMMLFGIKESRIDIVSFGEEQPAVSGSNDNAWQKNRRVELAIH